MFFCVVRYFAPRETHGEQKNTLSRRGTSLAIPIVLDRSARGYEIDTTVKNG